MGADITDMLATTLVDAQVDLNPHQVEAALFAFRSPLSKGVILADEVGLGKTIEAGLVIAQRWRLQKVIDGQDSGGVTQATGWQGGGGFRYYELAPTLLTTDRWGNLVINPEYDTGMLSTAMCKLEGFSYAPSETLWWQHGHSSERDFIYVTTQTLSAEQLEAMADELGTERSLLVCCGAYRGVTAAQAAQRWPGLTIKKIPKMVKDRCEWGHDDYSLNVANLPMAAKKPPEPAQDDLFGGDIT
jgi:adenine-specific DNA-methyltransferase